ncbi:hypothetical protein A2U01_0106066 [Trifolium medium]|uniref:Uncharacterized protein n=1 Tax=Trifolium medium TaxID=97028 RepID=A0A392V8Y8_9FABA|nr:hypothetical protein [Trifolium medium]
MPGKKVAFDQSVKID